MEEVKSLKRERENEIQKDDVRRIKKMRGTIVTEEKLKLRENNQSRSCVKRLFVQDHEENKNGVVAELQNSDSSESRDKVPCYEVYILDIVVDQDVDLSGYHTEELRKKIELMLQGNLNSVANFSSEVSAYTMAWCNNMENIGSAFDEASMNFDSNLDEESEDEEATSVADKFEDLRYCYVDDMMDGKRVQEYHQLSVRCLDSALACRSARPYFSTRVYLVKNPDPMLIAPAVNIATCADESQEECKRMLQRGMEIKREIQNYVIT